MDGSSSPYLYLSRFQTSPSMLLASNSKMDFALLITLSVSSTSGRISAPASWRALNHVSLVSLLSAARHTPGGKEAKKRWGEGEGRKDGRREGKKRKGDGVRGNEGKTGEERREGREERERRESHTLKMDLSVLPNCPSS
jgi:hypothetical protein